MSRVSNGPFRADFARKGRFSTSGAGGRERRMQDSNLRDALAPTAVFGTAALPDSANPPWGGTVFSSRCQESNLVRRLMRALHRPPCSTSSRGGRAIRTRAGATGVSFFTDSSVCGDRTRVSRLRTGCPFPWTNTPWSATSPRGKPPRSDARESNAVSPDPKSGGLPSPSHPAVPPPGLEPGTSPFVAARSGPPELRGCAFA